MSRSTPTVFISVHPFGDIDNRPLNLLRDAGMRIVVNPLARRLTENELAEFLRDADVLVAGTEPITDQVMSNAPQLGLIARVGIGLDNVDLDAARNRGITDFHAGCTSTRRLRTDLWPDALTPERHRKSRQCCTSWPVAPHSR